MRYAVIFLAGGALAALAAFAWPQETPAKKPHGLRVHYDELGLTAEQRPRVDALLADLESRVGPLCKSIAERRREIYEELRKESPDAARIDAAIEATVVARRDMQRVLVEHLTAVKPLLTPEQRGRLFDRLATERR